MNMLKPRIAALLAVSAIAVPVAVPAAVPAAAEASYGKATAPDSYGKAIFRHGLRGRHVVRVLIRAR
jgi:hypothetical protein